MLELLAKNDNYWREYAFNLCGDKNLADELTQTMYLKLSSYDLNRFKSYEEKQQLRFVRNSIRFIFLDIKKKKKDARLEELHYVQDNINTFEPNNEEQKYLDAFNSLDWVSQELLLESLDKSFRKIQKEYNIHYHYAYKVVKKAKETIRNTKN